MRCALMWMLLGSDGQDGLTEYRYDWHSVLPWCDGRNLRISYRGLGNIALLVASMRGMAGIAKKRSAQ